MSLIHMLQREKLKPRERAEELRIFSGVGRGVRAGTKSSMSELETV